MKQNKDPMELDYYLLYLAQHLREHQFPQATNQKFIAERAAEAYDTLCSLRREGRSFQVAQELAMRTLLRGLYVSRYDILYDIVEDKLWQYLPEEYWVDFTIHLLTKKQLHDILDRYEVNGDFLDREAHQPMLDELTGETFEILDDYGLLQKTDDA